LKQDDNSSPAQSFAGWLEESMHSERYVHPEFGFLSPTPRLRRDLRTAFFSLLFGIAIGTAAVIALSRTNNGDDMRGLHGGISASVISEEPTEAVLGDNGPRAASIEKRANKDPISKLNGSTADANSENRKTNPTMTCESNNSVCRNVPPPAGKPSATQTPATVATTSAAPSTSSEPTSEHSTAAHSEDWTGDPPQSKPLTHKKPSKTARNPNRLRREAPNYREDRAASRTRPVGELGRAYSFDRSFGRTGFWDWSR
jgi:hypothetical protein